MSYILKSVAVAAALIASTAQAGVVMVTDYSEFASQGELQAAESFENWGAAQEGITQTGATFIVARESVGVESQAPIAFARQEGTGSTMVLSRPGNTLTAWAVADDSNMIGMFAGTYEQGGYANFLVETNAGSTYSFSQYVNAGTSSLSFMGFTATDGDFINRIFITGESTLALNGFQAGVMNEVSPVPEPSTYALLGAGLAVLGFAARRKKQTAA